MRSITMCRTTVLAAVAALPALTFAAPASAPEATATEVGAWIVGDASFESPRFTKALRIDGLDAADVASRFASMPAGRRVAYSERVLAGFVGDEGDRVVVSGRITDHVGPWLDAASKRTRLEVEQLAKELASRGLSIDALLLGGENPLSAEKLDTADDLLWMAIRNDRRFEEIASAELSLAGAMSPSNPQWRAWNEFADVTIAKAIDESVVAPLRETNPAAWVGVPVTAGIGRSELDAMPIAIRMHGSFGEFGAGGATTAFDVLAGELELAVKASRGGRTLQPWIRPYSHSGTRGARSAVAGTLLWDELVRHATVLGNGRVVYEETRSRDLAAPDASRFAAVLDGVAEEFAGGASISSADASIRRGQGFVAVGVPTASGETLWRISFSPGIGGVDVEVDDGGLRVERRRGESGAWLRTAADSRIKFFERAFAGNDATTGGGLLAAPTSKPQGKVGPLLSGGPEGGTTLVDSGVGDLNGDGVIDGADLAIHLVGGGDSAWGGVSDLNGDGVVDGADMAIQLSGGLDPNWNGTGWDDLNGDGVVDGADLAISLGDDASGKPWNGTGWDDLNGDGINDGADLAINLAGGGSTSTIPGDLNGDGRVDGADLAINLSGGGSTSTVPGDRNGDGVVDGADLAIELAGRIVVRKPDVAGRPKFIDGGVSTVDDWADDDAGPDGSDGSSNTTGGGPPQIDPTTPVTPPAGAGGDVPMTPTPLPAGVQLLCNSIPDSTREPLLETLGIQDYHVIYQASDPQARESGLIDAEVVATAVRNRLGNSPQGWLMLDFEHPFLDVLRHGTSHAAYSQTVATMVNAVERIKQEFPLLKVTYYGVPSIPYWTPAGHSWAGGTPEYRSSLADQYVEYCRPVLDALDWISPTVYDRYERASYPAAQLPGVDARERAYRVAAMTVSNRYLAASGNPQRPVIPTVSPTYARGGQSEFEGKLIPNDEFLLDQVSPLLENGASGIAFWHATDWSVAIATGPEGSHDQQSGIRDRYSRNFLGSEGGALTIPQLQQLGYTNWQDPSLRQHFNSAFTDYLVSMVNASRERILELHSAAGAP